VIRLDAFEPQFRVWIMGSTLVHNEGLTTESGSFKLSRLSV
jgi:hypothetical protein